MDILFLCTANQCRSAMAEVRLRTRLEARGIDAHVHSAGQLEGGHPMTEETQVALGKRGFDSLVHESRQMTPALIQGADIVLAMTRQHLRDAAVQRMPDWKYRVFTLKELVRRGQEVRPRASGESLEDWLRKAGAGRTPQDLMGGGQLDDIPDPVSEPGIISFDEAAAVIEDLIDRLVRLIWGSA